MKNVLSAFNGDIVEKNNQISSLNIWLQEKEAPKSIQEQVNSLFNPVRIFLLPEIAVEDFYSYPEKLGLPSWLGQLNRTIDHHNSSDYNYGKENYQTDFYEKFLLSCKVGVDYSLMLHKWQIFLLTEFLPDQPNDDHMLSVIKLHENALIGTEITPAVWLSKREELDNYIQKINVHNDVIYHLRRTAYISVTEVIDIENLWISSVEAAVDAKVQNYVDKKLKDKSSMAETRSEIWNEIMSKLLIMLNAWN